jgi:ribosomal-protein-alanine N-acetyltransferase
MQAAVKIRRARCEDIEQIHTLLSICFDVPLCYEMLYDDICINKGVLYYVVSENGKIVGCGGMSIILDESHVTNICVLPDKREKGYAAMLIKKLCQKAESMGVNSMTLEVGMSNQIALHYFKKCGFTINGIRKKYYFNDNEDAYIMWREISVAKQKEN